MVGTFKFEEQCLIPQLKLELDIEDELIKSISLQKIEIYAWSQNKISSLCRKKTRNFSIQKIRKNKKETEYFLFNE